MKTSTIPSLRVAPELREAAEDVLQDGETLSSFIEQSLKDGIERRQVQQEFVARGLASRDAARRTGRYATSAAVLRKLERRLAAAKEKAKSRP